MKCIKSKDGEIRRVSDVEADNKIKIHGWVFVPKSEWKTNVRGEFKSTNVNPPKDKKKKN
jgi:hypothetical protein